MAHRDRTLREGLVQFKCDSNVFYNPAMATNRDLSIAMIETFGQDYGKKLKIFEGLSASGIRTCRYANELSPDLIQSIQANDIDKKACHQIKQNLELNNITCDNIVSISNGDCNTIMEHHSLATNEHFDVIDIDPYGSCVSFLNNSFRAIANNGLLCVTSTDLSILCSHETHAAYRKYASIPIHDDIMHEHAIRMILYRMANMATINNCAFEPLLSIYCDYYIRIYVRVIKKKDNSNKLSLNLSNVYYCYKCSIHNTNKIIRVNRTKGNKFTGNSLTDESFKCMLCGGCNKQCGPIWSGPLHNEQFVDKLLVVCKESFNYFPTYDRLYCKLLLVKRECRLNDCPYFIDHNRFSSHFGCEQIKNAVFRSILENHKYKWSLTHCTPTGTKTNAPFIFIINVFKQLLKPKTHALLEALQLDDVNVNMTLTKKAQNANKDKLFKLPPKNWGPKKAAYKNNKRQQTNQNKYKRKTKRTHQNTNTNTKDIVCKFWKNGYCRYQNCRFAHPPRNNDNNNNNNKEFKV